MKRKVVPKQEIREWLRAKMERLQEEMKQLAGKMKDLERRRDFLLEMERDLPPPYYLGPRYGHDMPRARDVPPLPPPPLSVLKPDTHTVMAALRMAGVEGMTAKQLVEVTGIKAATIGSRLGHFKAKGMVTHDVASKKYFVVLEDAELEILEMSQEELDAAIDAELLTNPTS